MRRFKNRSIERWIRIRVAVVLILIVSAALPISHQPGAHGYPVLTLDSPLPRVYIPHVARNYSAPDPRHGVAAGYIQCGDIEKMTGYGWVYNWGLEVCGIPRSDPRYVDMIWNAAGIGHAIYGEYLLGFNEPNLCSQANLSTREAALAWARVEVVYASKRLISPAPSQALPASYCQTWPGGLPWLWKMVDEYALLNEGRLPRFDAIAVHFYDHIGYETFEEYLTRVHTEAVAHGFDVPVWVTEFGTCTTGAAGVAWVMASVDWMSRQPWIERWALYSARRHGGECNLVLVGADGELTPMGEVYFSRRGGGMSEGYQVLNTTYYLFK